MALCCKNTTSSSLTPDQIRLMNRHSRLRLWHFRAQIGKSYKVDLFFSRRCIHIFFFGKVVSYAITVRRKSKAIRSASPPKTNKSGPSFLQADVASPSSGIGFHFFLLGDLDHFFCISPNWLSLDCILAFPIKNRSKLIATNWKN